MAFHVGQKVVCVDDIPERPGLSMGSLKKGLIYTIRWIDTLHIKVEEIVRPCGMDKSTKDTPYFAWRFRPILEKSTKTGMAILREIIDRETIKDDKPVKVPAHR